MTAVAVIGALIIGLSVGLLGAGGSIMTLPVLIFILNRPEKIAITEGMGIVGMIAFIGAFPYALRSKVSWRLFACFGFPGMIGAYSGAYLSYYLESSTQLTLFAITMLIVSASMLFLQDSIKWNAHSPQPLWMMIGEGFLIGCLTGIIGIGGGFLIVPTLLLLNGLSMQLAVGTSLLMITLNSFIGFLKQNSILRESGLHVDWELIIIFSLTGAAGSLIGSFLSNRISPRLLRKIFGINVMLIAIYILSKKF